MPAPTGNNKSILTLTIVLGAVGFCIVVVMILFFAGVFEGDKNVGPVPADKETVQVVKEVQIVETPAPSQAAPAPAPAPKASYSSSNDPYAFVSTTYLTNSDLAGRSKAELRIMRNAIYAHHGYKFKSADLKKYFGQFSWYVPTRTVVSPSEMSRVEQSNLSLIQSWE